MERNFEKLAEQVLDRIKNLGSIQGEAYIIDSREFTVEVAESKVENLKIAHDRGVGIRVLSDHRLGYAFTSDLSESSLDRAIEQALNNAKELEPDENWELPSHNEKGPELQLYDEATFQTSVDEKISLAQRIEEAARNYDDRVKITERAAYHDSKYQVLVYNTHGLQRNYIGSYCGCYAVVVGVDQGDNQTGFGLDYQLRYKDLDPVKVGREAGEKAVRMLGAKSLDSSEIPVVLDPYTAANFLGLFKTAFSGEAVLKGKSFFKDSMRNPVASKNVTMIDDGTKPGLISSMPYDGEGTATSRTVLVQDGDLQGYLHNSYTARKMGTISTGNSMRDSYKNTPEVGTTNFFLQEGSISPQQVLEGITKGLYITDVMGMHTANPISGDFSLGASGIVIENGQLTYPVKGIAIAGNLRDLLFDIEGVGNDLTFFISRGAPTIRIKKMSVSGN